MIPELLFEALTVCRVALLESRIGSSAELAWYNSTVDMDTLGFGMGNVMLDINAFPCTSINTSESPTCSPRPDLYKGVAAALQPAIGAIGKKGENCLIC